MKIQRRTSMSVLTKYNVVVIGPSCQRTCVYFVVLTEYSGGKPVICFMGYLYRKEKKTLDFIHQYLPSSKIKNGVKNKAL